jgi:HAD superfamily hydrolase (TIGR01509 family)
MSVPTHLILDLDDTIMDFSSVGEAAWDELIPIYAARIGLPIEKLRHAIDASRRWYWSDRERHREGRLHQQQARRTVVREAFLRLKLDDENTANELADAFSLQRELGVRPLRGAIEALEILRTNGASMVLLTNGEAALQSAKIDRFGLRRFFQNILIESEIGVGKPDPRAHRAALAALGVAPKNAWMIGDDLEFDIRPAKTLGMRAAWIRSTVRENESPADLVAPSLRALVSYWESSSTL